MYWFNPAAVATLMAAVLMDVLPVSTAEAPGLIFDTDICGDCDDVLALGMIHSLQSRGACRLLAVTVSVDNDLAAPFVDAVNTFYGRAGIPIGVVGKGGVVEKSKYLPLVEEKDDGGKFRYPHTLLSGKEAPPATRVLRQVAGRPSPTGRWSSPRSASPRTWPGCWTRAPTRLRRLPASTWSSAR